MFEYLDPVINGILLGGLYAVIGIGLSMIFGIMRQVNLAHGDLMIIASYFSLITIQLLGLHPLISCIFVLPAMFLFGFLIQYFLFNRVISRGWSLFS